MSSLSCFSGAGFERVLEFDQWLGTPQTPLKTPQNHPHLAHKLSGDVPQVNDIHLPKRETIIGFVTVCTAPVCTAPVYRVWVFLQPSPLYFQVESVTITSSRGYGQSKSSCQSKGDN